MSIGWLSFFSTISIILPARHSRILSQNSECGQHECGSSSPISRIDTAHTHHHSFVRCSLWVVQRFRLLLSPPPPYNGNGKVCGCCQLFSGPFMAHRSQGKQLWVLESNRKLCFVRVTNGITRAIFIYSAVIQYLPVVLLYG